MVYATIKNLSQFKKAVKVGAMFEITNHCRPEQIGKIRTITRKQTNGFYSSNEVEYREGKIIPVERDLWCEFGKATDYEFDGNKIRQYVNYDDCKHAPIHELIMEIQMIKGE